MAVESQNSRNPANSGSLTGVFIEVLGKFLGSVDDMLPAIVTAYDRGTNRATVRPLIKLLATSDATLSRAEIDSVPVLHIGGGGMVLSFNISVGDLGWLKANDADISTFLKKLDEAPPNTIRKHSFSDAVFIPDQFRKWTLGTGDEDAAVFQTLDASQRISIRPDEIAITSDSSIQIQSDDASQNISVTSSDISITSDAQIVLGDEGVGVIGLLSCLADVLALGDVRGGFGTRSLIFHTHDYDRATGPVESAVTGPANAD